ncbi:MAG: helix-turn-helix domain-containing protein [Clostridia bacterium]|nr:helix-turn-helix domain-containing protein [Clostridia bacterium]
MSFGQNLQFLRKMRNRMTQEELAEKMNVSRQTVSKWELDAAYPEISKLAELCTLFSCTMDELVRHDMTLSSDAYSNLRTEWVEALRYIRYAVISQEPESDAIGHVQTWARRLGIAAPEIIGWDFPKASQEQINVFNMHGYAAALILPDGCTPVGPGAEVCCQPRQKYLAITIQEPHTASFTLIPGAYKMLDTYMKANGISHKQDPAVLDCFEKEYDRDGRHYMDVYIAIQ